MSLKRTCSQVLFLQILLIFVVTGGSTLSLGLRPTFSLSYPFWPSDGVIVSNRTSIYEGYIPQPLDHFDPLNYDYWSQRFYLNDEFFEYGHPVFIFLGSKSPISPIWLQEGFMMELCKELNGIAFMPEHRFFGESWPIGDTELESLKYLTTEQVLADYAEFIKFIKKAFYLEDSKIIVVGASYAAALAVYMREDYPHLVDMVWSSSAAINTVYNFQDYFHMVGKVIYGIDPACYDSVKAAFDQLEQLIWLGCGKSTRRHRDGYSNSYYKLPDPQTCQLVEELFNLCDPLDLNNEDDIRNFFQYLAQSFSYTVQFNRQRGEHSMEKMCSGIFQNETNSVKPIVKLAQFVDVFNTLVGFKCIDFTQKKFCEQFQKTGTKETITDGHWIAPRQSLWLYCSQLGCLQTSDDTQQPFGHSFPVQFLVSQCKCAFGKYFTENFIQNQVEKHLTKYGGIPKTNYTSRVIFVNGQYDPWNPLSVLFDSQTSCENKVILIEGGSNIYDLGPTSVTDTEEVTLARNAIAIQLKQWLIHDEKPCCSN